MRPVVQEGTAHEKADCRHPNEGWVMLALETGPGQVRWGCTDCGWRMNGSEAHAKHPGRDGYPVVIPRSDSSRRGPLGYHAYLETDAWQERREAALNRACHRCQVCNSGRSLDVHHRTYARLGQELEADLTVLCRGCHDLFHKHGKLASWRSEWDIADRVAHGVGRHPDDTARAGGW